MKSIGEWDETEGERRENRGERKMKGYVWGLIILRKILRLLLVRAQ